MVILWGLAFLMSEVPLYSSWQAPPWQAFTFKTPPGPRETYDEILPLNPPPSFAGSRNIDSLTIWLRGQLWSDPLPEPQTPIPEQESTVCAVVTSRVVQGYLAQKKVPHS